MSLPEATLKKQAYEATISWTHYYSNVKSTRAGRDIMVKRWCTYFDAAERQVGEYSYDEYAVPFNTDKHDIKDGEVKLFEKAYRFNKD